MAINCIVRVILRMLRTDLRRLTMIRALAIDHDRGMANTERRMNKTINPTGRVSFRIRHSQFGIISCFPIAP